jgi:hypothetical protein
MTRETKVGLVVATSFLSLVGVVVAARMSTPEPSTKKGRLADTKTADIKTKPKESSPASEPGQSDKKEEKGIDKVIPATHDSSEKPGESSTPPPLNINVSGPLPGAEPVLAPKNTETKPTVDSATTAEDQKIIKELNKQTQLVAQGPPPPLRNVDPPAAPPALVASNPPNTGTAAAVKPSTGPETKPETKPESSPPTTKPEGPGPLTKPESIGFSTNPETAGNATKPQVTPDPKNPPTTAPVADNKPAATTSTPIPTADVKPAANTDLNHKDPPPAPIGATPPVSSPPIAVALAGGQTNNTLPQVKQYDINAYSIKPEDKSFADISKNVYGNDKYAQALVLFNRDHPQATEGVRQDPPQVRPGTPIFYPPKEILESKYGSVITGPAPAAPTNSSAVSVGAPTPLNAVTPGNPNTVSAPPPGTNVWTEPGGGKSYRVGNNPEHIREIARTALGDPERWSEIYRLNRTIDPAFLIPAGTVLKLP